MSLPAPTLESVTTIREDGSHRAIRTARVHGRFTTLRALMGSLLLFIYASLPWIPVNGYPAVFLDVAHRQFHFFGLTLVTQDLWVFFFGISGLAFSLFYVTALAGRLWCGWGCPQTVFLDIMRRVERFLEGEHSSMPGHGESETLGTGIRSVLKQVTFCLFALLISHLFLAYFVSLPALFRMMGHAPADNWGYFVFVALMTAALWFDFAWFREQFCIVLCPYGRLQSAMLDSDSLVIGYDSQRGEPRGRKGTEGAGQCVDCRRCVAVCPVGIDIRQGLQMECIGCAACVDACDDIMEKLGRKSGLVRYDSQNGFAGKKRQIIRPRILLYTALMFFGIVAAALGISTLRPVTISVTRMTGMPFVLSGDGVRNQFLLRVLNKRNTRQHFIVTLSGQAPSLRWTGGEEPITVGALGEETRTIVVVVSREDIRGPLPLRLQLKGVENDTAVEKTIPFVGPNNE